MAEPKVTYGYKDTPEHEQDVKTAVANLSDVENRTDLYRTSVKLCKGLPKGTSLHEVFLHYKQSKAGNKRKIAPKQRKAKCRQSLSALTQ